MAPRFVFGPLSPTQGPKSPKKWLFYHKSESGAESESDIRENSFAQSSHMDLGEWLSTESFNHVRCGSSTAHAWKNPPNSPHPFSSQKIHTYAFTKKKLKKISSFFFNFSNHQYKQSIYINPNPFPTFQYDLGPLQRPSKFKISKIGAFLRGSRAPPGPPGHFQRWLLVSVISV